MGGRLERAQGCIVQIIAWALVVCLVSRCLAPGPGVIERGGLVHESSGKDVVESVCFGLVGWLVDEGDACIQAIRVLWA